MDGYCVHFGFNGLDVPAMLHTSMLGGSMQQMEINGLVWLNQRKLHTDGHVKMTVNDTMYACLY